MDRVRTCLSEHGVTLVLALSAGVLAVAPSVLSVVAIGPSYDGVPFLYQDSEPLYLGRIHDVVDGHWNVSSPMLAEYKDGATLLVPMGEYLYALLSFLPLVSLNDIVLASKFIFPFILFVLVYAFTLVLARDMRVIAPRALALASASLVVVGSELLYPTRAAEFVLHGVTTFELSIWTRLVNPITGALFLFSFLLSAWGILRRHAWMAIPAGFFLGAMTGYIFSFALALVTLLLLTGYCWYVGRREAYVFIGALVLGGAINVFHLADFLSLMLSGGAQEMSLRNGLILTHAPLLNKTLIATVLFCATAFFLSRYLGKESSRTLRDAEVLIGSILIAALVVMNQQVFTGRTVWPQHFVQYTTPLSLVAALVWAGSLVSFTRRGKALILAGATLAIVVSFWFGASVASSFVSMLPHFADIQRYGAAFNYLNAAPKDCAVFVVEKEERVAGLIPALTHCNTYETSYVFVGLPRERIEHNYLAHVRFLGVTGKEAPVYFREHVADFRGVLFADWKEIFRYTNNAWLLAISDRDAIDAKYERMADDLAGKYRTFLTEDFRDELLRYRLDYVLWDAEHYPDWRPEDFPFLREVYHERGVHIYDII